MKLGTALAILLTLLAALALQVAHLPAAAPDWTSWLRPPWVLLCIVFWTLGSPGRLGLLSVWLLGFAVDALQNDPLGLNGAVFAAAQFATLKYRSRVGMYSLPQQVVAVVALVFAAEVVCQVVRVLAAGLPFSPTLWGPVAVSAVIWPFAHVLLMRLWPRSAVV